MELQPGSLFHFPFVFLKKSWKLDMALQSYLQKKIFKLTSNWNCRKERGAFSMVFFTLFPRIPPSTLGHFCAIASLLSVQPNPNQQQNTWCSTNKWEQVIEAQAHFLRLLLQWPPKKTLRVSEPLRSGKRKNLQLCWQEGLCLSQFTSRSTENANPLEGNFILFT